MAATWTCPSSKDGADDGSAQMASHAGRPNARCSRLGTRDTGHAPAEAAERALYERGSDDPVNVLVIDDQPDVRNLFADFLEVLGHESDLAADGREGLAHFDPLVHQVVVTDFLYAWIDGPRRGRGHPGSWLHDPDRDDQRVRVGGRRAAGPRGGAALHVQASYARGVRGGDHGGRRASGTGVVGKSDGGRSREGRTGRGSRHDARTRFQTGTRPACRVPVVLEIGVTEGWGFLDTGAAAGAVSCRSRGKLRPKPCTPPGSRACGG